MKGRGGFFMKEGMEEVIGFTLAVAPTTCR